MKKIVILATDLSGFGGTETVFRTFLDSIPESEITITTRMLSDEWLSGILQSRITNTYSKNSLWEKLKLILYLIRLDSVVLLINKPSRIFFAALVRKIFRKKYRIVSWIHFSLDTKSSVKPQQLKFLLKADMHLAISSEIREQLISLGIEKDKISLVYNPVKLNSNIIPASSQGKHRIIYIGRIFYDSPKNLSYLFESLAYLDNNWILDIYGDGDQNEKDKCLKLIHKLNIEDNIIWHGWITNPWDEIKECDFLVLSSIREGFGMTIVEAISRGIPCIATDCPTGPREIINSSNGVLVPLNDSKKFADTMKKVINKSIQFDRDVVSKSANKFGVKQYINRFRQAIND